MVTIVVLLILAGVTLNALFNENGILTKSKNAGNIMEDAEKSDLDAINDLDKWIDEKTDLQHPSDKIKVKETGDKVCKIFDMAGNCFEWTTEYSTYIYDSHTYPCTYRGGDWRTYQYPHELSWEVYYNSQPDR